MPFDITESIPSLLSAREATSASIANGILWDYTIGGIGFMRWAGDQVAYRRRSIPVQKNQFDASGDPGEQSLDGFWLRSQVSFHKGAGIKFYEPGSEKETQYRFDDSEGVDIWTPGVVRLLDGMTQAPDFPDGPATTAGLTERPLVCSLEDGKFTVFSIRNKVYYAMNDFASAGELQTPLSSPIVGTVTGLVAAQSGVVVVTTYGVWFWDALQPGGHTPWLVCGTGAAGGGYTPTALAFAKQRLVIGTSTDLVEVPLAPAATPVSIASPGRWTGVTEGPNCIYAAQGPRIFKIGLEANTSGTTPKLGQAFEVARMPVGEEILNIKSYLSRHIAIATTRGLRLGIIDSGGNVTYGPILLKVTLNQYAPLEFTDRFLYVGTVAAKYNERPCLYRVDISTPIGDDPTICAWAKDMRIPSAGCGITSISIMSDGKSWPAVGPVVSVSTVAWLGSNGGIYRQTDAPPPNASGWIRTGRIRYGTLEGKLFGTVDVTTTAPPPTSSGPMPYYGGVTVGISPEDDADLVTIGNASAANPTLVAMGTGLSSPVQSIALRFDVQRDPNTGVAPELRSYQVRALPAPRRTRQVQIPVAICDTDRDRNRTQSSRVGFGWERLRAMEELESSGQPVTIKDTISGDSFLAVVEQVDFEWQGQAAGNAGGIGHRQVDGPCLVTLRML